VKRATELLATICEEVPTGRSTRDPDLDGGRGRVCLRYTSTNAWTGEKHDSDYWIALTTTPQPLGGRRWWFVCPRRGDLVSNTNLH
jgi:hypothetical protein